VARIIVEQASVRGVELASGERIDAPVVVSNADPQRTFLGMIDNGVLSPGFVEAVQNIEMQGVALKVNCALERMPVFTALPSAVQPARVSICPSLEYVEAAWQQAEKGLLSTAPFMTVHIQSAIDGSLAPRGHHTLTCYAQYFPYNLDPSLQGWDKVRHRAGEIVLDTVAAYAPDLRSVILHTEVLSPLDLEDRFAMSGGHQFHGDLMPGQLFDSRPVPGCSGAVTPIEGLFLCGAGTHPGGCVWGAPGQRAAQRILADRGVC
jgi:phytoene dehydrogenase-like protein